MHTAKGLSRIPPIRRIVNWMQRSVLRKAINQLGGGDVAVLIHNFHPIDAILSLKPTCILYDYIDNAFEFTRLPGHVRGYWETTIRSADAITVTSPTLAEQVGEIRQDGIHYVGNGVEYDKFSSYGPFERPSDLPASGHIIGYVGAVYPWLDFDLIRFASEQLPQYYFLFLGPVHPNVKRMAEKLSRLPNVRFLGFKEYGSIPGYLAFFEAGIIPFRKTALTASVNPVKLYEYSAAGVPTVATDFSNDLRQFKDIVFVSRSREEFIDNLRQAVTKRHEPTFTNVLQSFAREHDWSKKTSKILELMKNEVRA